MKKYVSILVGLTLLYLPALAASDVTLTANTANLLVGSYTLVVESNSTLDTFTVNDSSVDFTMQPNTTIVLSSADRRYLDVSPTTYLVPIVRDCTDSLSRATLTTNHSSGAITVTVTPSTSNTCGSGSSSGGGGGSGGSSGGGGGGGGGSAADLPTLPTTPTVAVPAYIATLVSPVFNSNLTLGSKGNDVTRLQQILGIDVTGKFDAATRDALLKFQLKYKVVKSAKDAGAGNLGVATRAKLKAIYGTKAVVQVPNPAASVAAQKKALVDQLNGLRATVVALMEQAKQKAKAAAAAPPKASADVIAKQKALQAQVDALNATLAKAQAEKVAAEKKKAQQDQINLLKAQLDALMKQKAATTPVPETSKMTVAQKQILQAQLDALRALVDKLKKK